MNTRSHLRKSQIKVFLEKDGSVHKEISAVRAESLVFEGGGVRGISYIGATRALFESGMMQPIKRVAGTSAGALTAFVVALGYEQDKIEYLLRTTDMAELVEAKNLFTPKKLGSLLKYGYFNVGDRLLNKIRHVIKDRMNDLINEYNLLYADNQDLLIELQQLHINPDKVTFQSLRNLSVIMPFSGIKDLYIVAAKLSSHHHDPYEVHIFSSEHTPDVEIALAIRASASIPRLFKPVEINGQRYVDGGCLTNFPINVFNDHNYKPADAITFQGDNDQNFATVGIKVDTDKEVRELLHAPEMHRTLSAKIQDIIIDKLCGLPVSQSYKLNHQLVRDDFSHRSCQINDEGIKSGQFNLSSSQIESLIQRGYNDMKAWINNYYDCAIESRKYESFADMCENMYIDELELFANELMHHPQDVLRISGRCKALIPLAEIIRLQEIAKSTLERRYDQPTSLVKSGFRVSSN